MTHLNTATGSSRGLRLKRENALGLLIACIQERLSLSEREQKAAFRRLIFDEAYEDFLAALVDEWLGIKYSTALRAAQPVSVEAIRQQLTKRAQAKRAAETRVESAKSIMGARLLDLVAPNGKLLRDCTGAQCAKFGGFYERVAETVGANRIVGKVLSPDAVAELFKST